MISYFKNEHNKITSSYLHLEPNCINFVLKYADIRYVEVLTQ